MDDAQVAKLCREWLSITGQALESADCEGYQAVRKFSYLYEGLCERASSLAAEAAARNIESLPLSVLPPRLSPKACTAEERKALEAASRSVQQLHQRVAPPVRIPPGWFLRSEPPENVSALRDWLTIRSAWFREWKRGYFSEDFTQAIAYDLGCSSTESAQLVWLYTSHVLAHARYWLEDHGVFNSPPWDHIPDAHRVDSEGAELFTELIEFLRSLVADEKARRLVAQLGVRETLTHVVNNGHNDKTPPASADTADTGKKTRPVMPDSPDVRDLCRKLEKYRGSGKSLIQIARDHTRESPGTDPKAQSLLRQARRFRHLWDRTGG